MKIATFQTSVLATLTFIIHKCLMAAFNNSATGDCFLGRSTIPCWSITHWQERCPTRQEWWRQSTHYHTILSMKTIEATPKRRREHRERPSISPGLSMPLEVGGVSSQPHSREADQSIPSFSFELSLHLSLSPQHLATLSYQQR